MYNWLYLYLWLSYYLFFTFIYFPYQSKHCKCNMQNTQNKRIWNQFPQKPCKMHNQPNQQTPPTNTHFLHTTTTKTTTKQQHNITLGCVGSRCRWFINRPPPTHHTNLDAIYRWRTTRTRMSKRSCWARRACAPVSRAKIWSLGKYCKINELVDHSAIKQPNKQNNQPNTAMEN